MCIPSAVCSAWYYWFQEWRLYAWRDMLRTIKVWITASPSNYRKCVTTFTMNSVACGPGCACVCWPTDSVRIKVGHPVTTWKECKVPSICSTRFSTRLYTMISVENIWRYPCKYKWRCKCNSWAWDSSPRTWLNAGYSAGSTPVEVDSSVNVSTLASWGDGSWLGILKYNVNSFNIPKLNGYFVNAVQLKLWGHVHRYLKLQFLEPYR